MSRSEHRRQERLESKAREIVEGMPPKVEPSDDGLTAARKMLAQEEWAQQVKHRAAGDPELAQLIVELMRQKLGLSVEEAERADSDEAAQALLHMGFVKVIATPKAVEAMRREGADPSSEALRLADRYLEVWKERSQEMLVDRRVGGETLRIGRKSSGIEVNIWVRGELGLAEPVPQAIFRSGDFN